MTWTLIESFQRDQKMKSLSFDEPLNQDNHTWNGYRLSKNKNGIYSKRFADVASDV